MFIIPFFNKHMSFYFDVQKGFVIDIFKNTYYYNLRIKWFSKLNNGTNIGFTFKRTNICMRNFNLVIR